MHLLYIFTWIKHAETRWPWWTLMLRKFGGSFSWNLLGQIKRVWGGKGNFIFRRIRRLLTLDCPLCPCICSSLPLYGPCICPLWLPSPPHLHSVAASGTSVVALSACGSSLTWWAPLRTEGRWQRMLGERAERVGEAHLHLWSSSPVTTPPMVGPTWPRVRSILGSDCLPALSQGTALLRLDCGLISHCLHCYRAHPMSRDWGCISMSLSYLSMQP